MMYTKEGVSKSTPSFVYDKAPTFSTKICHLLHFKRYYFTIRKMPFRQPICALSNASRKLTFVVQNKKYGTQK